MARRLAAAVLLSWSAFTGSAPLVTPFDAAAAAAHNATAARQLAGAVPRGPSQVLVLGMHHTGTSIATRAMDLLGLYVGTREELIWAPGNPLKFWERHDVVAVNEKAMNTPGAAPLYGPKWVHWGFDQAKGPLDAAAARRVLAGLDGHGSWATKDPRMCLNADEWLALCANPVCVLVDRDIDEWAWSTQRYSSKVASRADAKERGVLSLDEWKTAFKVYQTQAAHACRGHPTVRLSHAALMGDPYAAIVEMHAKLEAAGVTGTAVPTRGRVAQALGSLVRDDASSADASGPAAVAPAPRVVGLDKATDATMPLRAGDCVGGETPRCLPRFLIVGASEAGVNELSQTLTRHPNLAAAARGKHFFDTLEGPPKAPYAASREYAAAFAPTPLSSVGRVFNFDPTSTYLQGANPADIARAVPGAKIVVVVRDPAVRLRAAYDLAAEKAPGALRGKRSFDAVAWTDAMTPPDTVDGLVSGGRYAEHLNRYLQAGFKPSDILVVFGLESQPADAAAAVAAHAGLPAFDFAGSAAGGALPHPLPAPSQARAASTRAALDELYQSDTSALVKLITESGVRTDLSQDQGWPEWAARATKAHRLQHVRGTAPPAPAAGAGRAPGVREGPLCAFPWAPSGTAPTSEMALTQWPPATPPVPDEAYVTLLTGSDPAYLKGTLAQGISIRTYDTSRDMVLMVVRDATPASWAGIATRFGWTVKTIEPLEEPWFYTCDKNVQGNFKGSDRSVRWGKMASKLRLWELVDYKRVLFIDADAFYIGDTRYLFSLPGEVVAEKGIRAANARNAQTFNAGFMLVKPSLETFSGLMARSKLDPPNYFRNTLDCTEQGLINAYFLERKADINFNQMHRSFKFETHDTGALVPIGHFITMNCPKPWGLPVEAIQTLPEACNYELYYFWKGFEVHLDSALKTERKRNSGVVEQLSSIAPTGFKLKKKPGQAVAAGVARKSLKMKKAKASSGKTKTKRSGDEAAPKGFWAMMQGNL